MAKVTKTLSTDLDLKVHKKIKEIINRTGERKVELIERLISSEHERITNGSSESGENKLQSESFSQMISELSNLIKKNSDSTNSIREGANRIYCAVLIALKELIRTMHFISGVYSGSALLNKEQISNISYSADQEAINTFSAIFSILTESHPKEIVEMLQRK
jgi:hypothetical protein